MEYLLKSIACLLLLLLVHRVLLQREALHRFNRFFLLFSVVASFFIPLYTIEVPQEVSPSTTEVISEPIYFEATLQDLNQEQVFAAVPESPFNWEYLLFGLYGLISFVFLYRFGRNIKILVNKIQGNIKINYRGQTLVLLKEDSLPFSFLKYIFVSESDLENGKFTDAVFAHESTHIQEKHSWDNLFIEVLLVPFWFHPGLHWAKASIKLNHEFIADQIALRSTPLEKYESQLLAMMLSEQKYGLASSLNFSLTKKRFEMMKRKTVNSHSWIKVLVLVPVLGALVYIFSERVVGQPEDSNSEGEVSSLYFHSSQKNSDEISIQDEAKQKYYSQVKFLIETDQMQYEIKDFGQLSSDQKSRLALPSAVEAPPKRTPDDSVYQALKNGEEYGLWLDGKVLPNSDLDEIPRSEIVYFVTTPIHSNARSEEFPQPYQTKLFTEGFYQQIFGPDGQLSKPPMGTATFSGNAVYMFDIAYMEEPFTEYQNLYGKYEDLRNSKPHYIDKAEDEKGKLHSIFIKLAGMYDQFDSDLKQKITQPIPPIAPYVLLRKDGEVYYKLEKDLTDEERLQLSNKWDSVDKRASDYYSKHYSIVGQSQLTGSIQNQAIDKARYYLNATLLVKNSSGEFEEVQYDELPAEIQEMLPPAPNSPISKMPGAQEYESWKNSDDFAIWIDGSHVPNSELEKMKNTDVVFFMDSFVHENARSERFPQEHQVNIYTSKGYEEAFGEKSEFEDPLTEQHLIHIYPLEKRVYVQTVPKNEKVSGATTQEQSRSTQRIAGQDEKAQNPSKWPPGVKAETLRKEFQAYIDTNQEYEALRNQAPHFVKRSKAEQDRLNEMFSKVWSMYLQIPFHDKPKVKYPSRPFAPYMQLESNGEVYYKLAKDLTAEELEKYPPPPPPLTPADQIEDYKKVSYQYELMRNKGRNDASLSMEERNTLFLLYNELQLKFLRMGAPERREVKMVNFPYYRVEENGKNVFKAVSELSPEQRALNNC
ncbi:M56 family metallopeptidase [Algoriphagus halophytocola]|uniref:M56 family metallopeptidase n=1 Tax=Algoriphagus halophytocola TaxID=2991499 RepID=A0ABY6MG14_9BACT|nr:MULTISPECIES: M56 family metallopeptidase [unclassified Algoriphagus]UZD22384.1 M56 family metallopeptidase [Algoriphagus sp. TR-M5]WBL43643.1 M56 family metallopeptidase [Algoriphagus sp. TR-M9]